MHGPQLDYNRSPRRQWWIVIAFGCLTLLCGTIGAWQYETAHAQGDHSAIAARFADAFYTSVQMLILHTPHFGAEGNWWLRLGQWFGAGFFSLTALTVLWGWLRQESGTLAASTWTNHTVICGLGQKGLEIIRSIRKRNPQARIVAIDPDPDQAPLEQVAKEGVHLIFADATDTNALRRARIAKAGEIIAITPSDEKNVRIATAVQAARTEAAKPATCFVHLSGIHLRHSLQPWTEQHRPNRAHDHTPLRFFDTFDDEARRVLLDLPLDGKGIHADDPRSVHVVIIGQGRMGSSILLRAGKIGHFANEKLIRLSVIDREADLRREQLLFRYPALAERGGICKLEYHQHEADSHATRQLVERWAKEPDTLLHVFVCMDNNVGALDVGLRLCDILANCPAADLRIRINSHNSLAPILEGKTDGQSDSRIDVFGMVEDCCRDDAFRHEVNESLARAIHGDFAKARQAGEPERAGEATLRPWDQLSEDTRESNRQQADHIPIKMRAIGCEIVLADPKEDPRPAVEKFERSEIELLAKLEHTRWNADRLLAGFRPGPVKDLARRIHNCLVAWDELEENVKDYDRETVEKIPMWLGRQTPAKKVVRT